MSEVTRILSQIESGEPAAAEKLLPLVYDELRRLAAAKMREEQPGHTLAATALVHEAYLKLVGPANEQGFENRGHFFAAAAEAMRRILIDWARRRQTERHGSSANRAVLEVDALAGDAHDPEEILAVHELLDRLAEQHPRKAQVVKLRYFAGCTQAEASSLLGITPAMAQDDWVYARAWLKREWRRGEGKSGAE